MTAYYNEHDSYAAQWLRNLIAGGHIASGDVDERSIVDVKPDDLRGYTQCHWFAGIGGWSYALRLAGWPDDGPVWTGSCPCQPFSAAGQGKAADDERHLWPAWFALISECRPGTIFGEQVEAAIGWGWFDLVRSDLEAEGYACGMAVLPACGVGAPHVRQRLWFVADTSGVRDDARGEPSDDCIVGNAECEGLEGWGGPVSNLVRSNGQAIPCGSSKPWSDCDWLPCTDGKARPVEPGTFPLATGILGRVGRLRAYGNAIVPQVAQAFIEACMSLRP